MLDMLAYVSIVYAVTHMCAACARTCAPSRIRVRVYTRALTNTSAHTHIHPKT